MKNYSKPALDFSEQAKLLISRGLISELEELTKFLSKVNYYRLSGYLYPFRKKQSDQFITGTSLEKIRSIYNFDTRVRILTFAAIETIDIAILRTQMVKEFTLKHGPFCYTLKNNYDEKLSCYLHNKLLSQIDTHVLRSNEEFIEIYKRKYSGEQYLPFWMVAEVSTFSVLSRIFEKLQFDIQVPIAKNYNLHSRVLVSWLHTLSNIRNICAHHSRLWNRVLPIRPAVPIKKHLPEFHNPKSIDNQRFYVVLAILKYLLDIISPENTLIMDFNNLVDEYSSIPLKFMGFPEDWQEYPVFCLKQ